MKIRNPKLLIAGGGTGGHVLAGIAIAEAWGERYGGHGSIHFVGSLGGMEERLVPRAGFSLSLLQIGSLNRVSFKKKLKTLIQLPFAFLKSAQILWKVRPNSILGVGGYSSGPVLLVARILCKIGLLKAKIGILEQNSIPGFTNRILGHFSDIVFAAFPGTETRFPKKTVIVTGNPIRASIQPMPSAGRNPFTLFIFGGSQGAFGINTLVIQAISELIDLKYQIRWVHQTGEKDFERVRDAYQRVGMPGRIEKFIDDMPSVYREASLLICRSGSSTLAEIAAVGRASILIPLPTAADNHQEFNAKVLSDAEAAYLFPQLNQNGSKLAQVIRHFVTHPGLIESYEKKVTQFYQPLAAKNIVHQLVADLSQE